MTEQTWRHENIRKAQAARVRAAEEKWAARLRERGWTCVPPVDEIQALAEKRVVA